MHGYSSAKLWTPPNTKLHMIWHLSLHTYYKPTALINTGNGCYRGRNTYRWESVFRLGGHAKCGTYLSTCTGYQCLAHAWRHILAVSEAPHSVNCMCSCVYSFCFTSLTDCSLPCNMVMVLKHSETLSGERNTYRGRRRRLLRWCIHPRRRDQFRSNLPLETETIKLAFKTYPSPST